MHVYGIGTATCNLAARLPDRAKMQPLLPSPICRIGGIGAETEKATEADVRPRPLVANRNAAMVMGL